MGIAHRVFDEMLVRKTITLITLMKVDERSLISWSKVLSEFVKNGYVNRAEFFLNMLRYDVPLDSGCFSISLDGCSEYNNLEFGLRIHGLTANGHVLRYEHCYCFACIVAGKSLHAYPIKAGLEDDTAVGNAIITMFAECGIVKDAYEIFTCTNRDWVTWNGDTTLSLIDDMRKSDLIPTQF
ncbi:pentatricopeptide repeat-containing protein [Trifolium repens]|nr:pentatricopeptide repeat-containing protein [Trifolium repens]